MPLLRPILLVVVCCFFASPALANNPDNAPSLVPGYSMGAVRSLFDDVEKTGLGHNSISAIDDPEFLSVSDASLSMDDNEIVFIVTYPEGVTRIYPQRVLVWHEVVNDTLPDPNASAMDIYGQQSQQLQQSADTSGRRYTLSYSPLSGAVVAFRSVAGSFPSSFSTTGELINANHILFDRISYTNWSQLLGIAFDGPLTGRRLERIPVVWAKWKGVKTRYMGKAEVLSRSTGMRRPYGRDPYGSYLDPESYYHNTTMINSLAFYDKRLHPKTQILGLEYESMFGALQKNSVKQQKVINFTMGITPMVALYDEELDAVRVFDRRPAGKRHAEPLTFSLFEGNFIDKDSNSIWTAEGLSTYGKYREVQLEPIYSIDCMWMTWAAFHKGCPIYPER